VGDKRAAVKCRGANADEGYNGHKRRIIIYLWFCYYIIILVFHLFLLGCLLTFFRASLSIMRGAAVHF